MSLPTKAKLIPILLFTLILIIGLLPVNAAASGFTSNTTENLGHVRPFNCANEFIQLNGNYHTLFHVTFTPTGQTHVIAVMNSSGVVGTGMTSGVTYRVVDGEHRTTNIFGAPGFESNYFGSFRLVATGQAANLLVTVVTHVTYSPELGFTAEVTNVITSCQA
jgi:hypothetical protein